MSACPENSRVDPTAFVQVTIVCDVNNPLLTVFIDKIFRIFD